ncbi:MAG: hypothetical protein PVH77_11005 [Phycisphaerales bacterium]|jgi:hypothetical protein
MKKTEPLSPYADASYANLKAKLPDCANYDHHYGGCLFRDECLVQQGERCAYFEKVILETVAVS